MAEYPPPQLTTHPVSRMFLFPHCTSSHYTQVTTPIAGSVLQTLRSRLGCCPQFLERWGRTQPAIAQGARVVAVVCSVKVQVHRHIRYRLLYFQAS